MPCFFFHVTGDTAPDVEGYDLPDVAIAKCQAVRMAGQMICDRANSFWNVRDFGMTVTDDRGLTLFALNIVGTDAPAIAGRPTQASVQPSPQA